MAQFKPPFRVTPDHPLYAEVRKALDARNLHYAKRAAKIARRKLLLL